MDLSRNEQGLSSKTAASNGENQDDLITSLPLDRLNSQTVHIKQFSWSDIPQASPSTLPEPLHSQTCMEKQSKATSQGEDSLASLQDIVHPQTVTSWPCQVKIELASENEQNWEQKNTVESPFHSTIKKDVLIVDHYSMEDDMNQKRTSKDSDGTAEMDVLSDDAGVKSENDTLPPNLPDADISEHAESMFNPHEIEKQHHSQNVNNKNTNEAARMCSLCGKIFNTSQACLLHVRRTHTDEKPYNCEFCGKAFKRRSDLKCHIISHSDERPYSCDLCEKTFKRKDILLQHKETCHSDERPYSCDICGKAFKRCSDMKKHEASHSSERPYSCDVCGMAFKRKDCLVQHKPACHSNEKPYSCDICGKDFKRKDYLVKHKAGCHSDERPHSCDICGKTFKQRSKLVVHKRIHTGEKPHLCQICGKAFLHKRSVRLHVQQTHEKKGHWQ